jgi:serine/threonine protein kinase
MNAVARTCIRCGAGLSADSALDVCPRCIARQALAATDGPGTDTPPSPALLEQPGDRIGHYKLLQKLGEGGCGVVYMAEQEEPVRRRVALKIIKPGMDTRQVVARFEAERQALALMDHPNIAKVFDGGTTTTGRPFFVMELVRGVRITEYCDENNLPTTQRLDLFAQVCHAVQHAHQKGIIHRDLKPSNILVTINDGVPVPKVIDFGIAKATEQRLTDKTLFTEFHQFIGTPAYMSPEQALMTSLDIDTRSDIYSLGVLLYELLTGRTPLDTPGLLKAGVDEMRRTIREVEPARPSNRLSTLPREDLTTAARRRSTNPPQLIHAITGDLDWIVMKCLEKDRTRRYETANSLAADIHRHLKNEPIVARPPSRIYQFQKLARRNRVAFAAAGAVLVALLAGLGVSTWAFMRERAAREQAAVEAAKSQTVARFHKDMITSMEPSIAMGRDTTLLREFADQTFERLGKEPGMEPAVELELRAALARVFLTLRDLRQAEAIYRDILPRLRNLPGLEEGDLAEMLRNFSEVLLALHKDKEAEAMAREALAISRKRHGKEHDDVSRSLHLVAQALKGRAKYDEAAKLQLEGLALARRLHGPEHLKVATQLLGLGLLYSHQGKADQAEPYFRDALAMRRKLTHDAHPSVIEATKILAGFLNSQGNRSRDAAVVMRELLSAQRKALGSENRMALLTLSQLGANLSDAGRSAEAEPLAREALALARKLYGDEHMEVAKASGDLGVFLDRLNRHAEAEPYLRETVTTMKKCAPTNSWFMDQAWNNLVINPTAQEKYDEAEVFARECLELARGNAATDPKKLEERLLDLASTAYRQGKYAEAEPLYREAIQRRRARRPPGHEDVVGPTASLGRLLADWPWAGRGAKSESRGPKAAVVERALEAERVLRESLEFRLTRTNAPAEVRVFTIDQSGGERLKSRKPSGGTAPAWRIGDTQSRLGAAVLSVAVTDPALTGEARHAKFVEAESLLLEGNEALQEDAKADDTYKRDALERLIRLYDAWQKPEQAADWRAALARSKRRNAAPEPVP